MELRLLLTVFLAIYLHQSVHCDREVENISSITFNDTMMDNQTDITSSDTTDYQESDVFRRLLHEVQLMNKHLTSLKSVFEQLKQDIKEDVNVMVDELSSLKVAVGETEMDLQTARNSIESIEDWTTATDGKFREIEKTLKSNCNANYPVSRRGHHNGKKGGGGGGGQNKHGKKIRSEKLKEFEKDYLQADSSIVTSSVDIKSRSADCCEDIKLELKKLHNNCAVNTNNRRPSSCADIQHGPGASTLKNGPKAINPTLYGFDSYLNVFCDFETDGGGWTVFQRRDDYGLPRENFERNWTEYKTGFGDVSRELWLGNDAIYALTNQEPVELRIELENFTSDTKYAVYSLFRLEPEKDHYRIQLGKYSGDAADSLGRSRGMMFSTKDSDSDKWTGNCAQRFRGGWWFNNCHDANLNGFYYGGEHESYADGINWYHWTGFHYSLKRTEMKIRPMWFSQLLRKK